MCVVSNIGDHYGNRDGWPWRPVPPTLPQTTPDFDKVLGDFFAQREKDAEIADLKKRVEQLEELIRKGKEYDEATGQSNCELDEKKEALRKIAKELGVEINFP